MGVVLQIQVTVLRKLHLSIQDTIDKIGSSLVWRHLQLHLQHRSAEFLRIVLALRCITTSIAPLWPHILPQWHLEQLRMQAYGEVDSSTL